MKDVKTLSSVMLPILAAQLSTVGMSFINTVMAGHAGAADLAGVSVGTGIFLPIFEAAMGMLMAASPLVARLVGQGHLSEAPFVIRTGMYLAAGFAVLFGLFDALAAGPILAGMGLAPEVEHIAAEYLHWMSAAALFGALVIPLRAFLDASGHPAVSMRFFLWALPVNAFFDGLFVFGSFGCPPMGGAGAGLASAVTYAFILALFLHRILRDRALGGRAVFQSWRVPQRMLGSYLRLGIPSGLTVFMETSLFGLLMIGMARFGTVALAAYQIADNYANLVYMIPLSCSMALTILVGVAAGRDDHRAARRYRSAGFAIALGCAAVTALCTVLGHETIAALYAEDGAVIREAGWFLLLAAGWQCFDAVAAPAVGTLRGYQDAKFPFLITVTAYWGCCLPLSLLLDRGFEAGASSYWIGLDAGIALSAVLVVLRLRFVERRAALRDAEALAVDAVTWMLSFLLGLYEGARDRTKDLMVVILPRGHVLGGYAVGKKMFGLANCGQVP